MQHNPIRVSFPSNYGEAPEHISSSEDESARFKAPRPMTLQSGNRNSQQVQRKKT